MEQKTADGIPVTAEPGISIDAAISSAPFKNWLASMDRERFDVRSIHIQSVDMFGPRVGFIKLKADVVGENGKFIPGIVFMRGGSVGILPVFMCKGRSYAVLTVQPRVPTGRFDFVEIPAGMLDGSGNFGGVAAKELQEELALTINEAELTDLSAFAGHKGGFFPSPGGSDETIRLFSLCKEVGEDELSSMNGRCTGLLEEGEQITLKIVPLEDLWTIPDGKTIVAYTLYQKLLSAA
jgi:ADP-sugar diphosphatase